MNMSLTAFNQSWMMCGIQFIPTRVYRSSIEVFFHTDAKTVLVGFKMMYATLPSSQEPQQLSDSLYNCSVPHFHSFKPLLSCNMVTECQGNEDEEDCDHHSNACGDGAVDAGTKCYRFVRRGVTTTWGEASYECSQHNQNLVTMATTEEFRRFKQIVASARNRRRVFIGAKMAGRRADVTADSTYRHLWKWVDGRTAFFLNLTEYEAPPRCVIYSPGEKYTDTDDC